jgi:3-oxoadipate enol-lactonase
MWDEVAARLTPRRTVVRYDTRGHGGSEVVPTPFTVDDLAGDVVRLLDELRIPRAAFVGLSMGGMVGQALALARPDRVDALVLANTSCRYPPASRDQFVERARLVRTAGMAAIADTVVERFFSPSFRAANPMTAARFRTGLLAIDPSGYAACCDAIREIEYEGRLSSIACPTLVIGGSADVSTPPAMVEAIAARIPGARLEVLPDVAHLSAVERPAQFAALVEEFLKPKA